MTDFKNFENVLDSRVSEALRASDFVKKILGPDLFEICALCYLLNDKQRAYITETIHHVLKHDL